MAFGMKPYYRKHVKTTVLIWGCSAVLALLVYLIVLAPQNTTKQQVDKMLADKKQLYENAMAASRAETRTKLKKQIEQLQNMLMDFVIDFEQSTNLALDISQIANGTQVSSFSISGKGQGRSRIAEIPNCKLICENRIDIGFNADFTDFATFLNSLERHRPVIFVDKFKIDRFGKTDSTNKVKMNLAVFVKKRQHDTTTDSI